MADLNDVTRNSDGIYPPGYVPRPSLKSMQGMLVNRIHNAGKNRGIDPQLVEDVEHEISLAVEDFSTQILVPMMDRENFKADDLFKLYGIYREGVAIRKQVQFPKNCISFDNMDVDEWIRVMQLPINTLLNHWSVPVLTVIYANLSLYYQSNAMRLRYQNFYESENALDWVDAILENEEKNKKNPNKASEYDPPKEWVDISVRWQYLMFKKA